MRHAINVRLPSRRGLVRAAIKSRATILRAILLRTAWSMGSFTTAGGYEQQ